MTDGTAQHSFDGKIGDVVAVDGDDNDRGDTVAEGSADVARDILIRGYGAWAVDRQFLSQQHEGEPSPFDAFSGFVPGVHQFKIVPEELKPVGERSAIFPETIALSISYNQAMMSLIPSSFLRTTGGRWVPRVVVTVLLAGGVKSDVAAQVLSWNVREKFGISAEGISEAVRSAKEHFKAAPNDVIVLKFDEGTHQLEGKDSAKGTIDLSGVKPGPQGRLVFQGAGMDRTVLVFSDNIHAIAGQNVYRVTMADMHMTRRNYTVTQGLVVETSPGKVVLDLQEGFPTPAEIFDAKSDQGRYLRRYTNSKTDPQIVVKNNPQFSWVDAVPLGGRRWQVNLRNKTALPNYEIGQLLGIKSKHGGQTYWFKGGSDFVFKSVKWTHKTRGVFRGGFDKIQILDCVTDRAAPIAGQTPCLASPDGGPQIGQPWDPPTTGNLVRNCRFLASGDDAVAFFHSTGEISGCQIQDAFARGILLSNSPEAVLKDNTLVRCPVQRSKDHKLPHDLSELME